MIIFPDVSYRVFAVLRRHLIVWSKLYKTSIVGNLGEPFIILLALGYGFAPFIPEIEGLSYMQFLAPGLVAYTAMNAAMFECTYGSYARMTVQNTYDAMIATPVNIDEVVAGEIFYGTVKSLVSSVGLLIVLGIFNLLPSNTFVFVPFIVLLTGLAFSSLSMLVTSLSHSWDFFSYYFTLIVAPMFFLAGIFFPLSSMPPWVEDVAWFTPLYHAVELSKGLIWGRFGGDLVVNFLWLGVFSIVIFIVAVGNMRRRIIV